MRHEWGTDTPRAPPESEHRVTPLELFFDLVFVFAITQVTTLLVEDPTWRGVGHGMLVLGALWWAWAGYTWLTNAIDPEEGAVRLAFFAAMAAMLVTAIAVPHAFGRDAITFGDAYLAVRLLHLGLYLVSTRDQPGVARAVARMAPAWVVAPLVIVVAGRFHGAVQELLWATALLVDFGGALVGRGRGWEVHAGHFAERHGLIIIVALGESVVSIGTGAGAAPLGSREIAAAILAMAVAAGMWWWYFDVVAIVAERRLTQAVGAARALQARDSYTYLHFPMTAGIVLFAFGVRTTLAHTDAPLAAPAAAAIAGGIGLYLSAHVGFRLRNVHTLNRQRAVVAVALFAFAAAAAGMQAFAALCVVSALSVALTTYETVRFGDARRRIRGAPRAT